MKIVFGQDSCFANETLINEFELKKGDVRFNKNQNCFLFDFVGFIINPITEKALIVFPKNYFSNIEIADINDNDKHNMDDCKLLFDVIKKYSAKKNSNIEKFFGEKDNYLSDYPFYAYFNILDYYLRFGVYQEKNLKITKNSSGKINWKYSIQNSDIIISNGNIIYTPLYRNKINSNTNFLSECMIYIMNYTAKNFSFLYSFPIVEGAINDNYFKDYDFVIKKLFEYKSSTFKDIDRELIDSMIHFFECLKNQCYGGTVHMKISYFDMIWQDMVNDYLNNCFVKTDSIGKIIFDDSKRSSTTFFSSKELLIDKSKNRFKIIVDHFYEDDLNLYLFDSKYHTKIENLEYKQLCYDLLIRATTNKTMNDCLIAPGKKDFGTHINIIDIYKENKSKDNIVNEQYIEMKKIMKLYLSFSK